MQSVNHSHVLPSTNATAIAAVSFAISWAVLKYSMIRTGGSSATRHLRHALTAPSLASSPTAQYGRSAVYRRLLTFKHLRSDPQTSTISSLLQLDSIRSSHHHATPHSQHLSSSRHLQLSQSLHTSTSRYQQPRPQEDVRDPPREEAQPEAKPEDADHKSSEGAKSQDSENGSSGSKD